MAKQLNVNLSFNADTSQARAHIQSLVSELNKLGSSSNLNQKGLPLTKDLIEAQNAAKELSVALNNAFDTNTGTLDLSSFNQSLQKSGMSLQDYSAKLTLLGQEGDQAFLKVAQSIINTQAPLKKTNSMLAEFATTLKNTARWQVSSSILHGFMGAVQSAYGYAQDLNKSLNNIRIVTGYNTDQMSAFAEQANKAAKALSTTTTKYTDASLIYYQQGLTDSEVSERTKITVDMANAAGQSAEVVSDQLTAIWNNFYDGSKSLEYYADVMTALGAATASSTDEIAGGLEKFAAVADTIGLSYEYAASALATITSNTRQSEEVVGTALKTIFARIQGLNLGETLDDGTTLNKYSEALDRVGISIFENNGEIKKMDAILDEMASKWEVLNEDQQIALAQTVAGVRQYNQLVSLMDNWNNGDNDSMTANLSTAYGSTGALQEQADIYAESWEASKDRVRASLEGIYQTLIDDDFFIDINNLLAKLISGVDKFVDSIGGAKGVLLLFGSIMSKVFANDIAKGINNSIDNIRILSGTANKEIAETQKAAKDIALEMTKDLDSKHIEAMRQALETTYTAQEELRQSAKFMSADQLAVAESAMETAKSYNEIAIAAGKAADETRRAYEEQTKEITVNQGAIAAQRLDQISTSAVTDTGSDLIRDAYAFIDVAKEMGLVTDTINQKIKEYAKALSDSGDDETKKTAAVNSLMQAMSNLVDEAQGASQTFILYHAALEDSAKNAISVRSNFDKMKNSIQAGTFKASRKELEELANELETAGYDVKKFRDGINRVDDKHLSEAFTGVSFSVEEMNSAIAKAAYNMAKTKGATGPLTKSMRDLAITAGDVQVKEMSAEEALKRAGEAATVASGKIKNLSLVYQTLGSALSGGLQGITSLASGITSLKSAFDTLNNPDLGTFEKYTSILMSLGTALPMITGGFKNLGNVLKFVASSQKQGLTAQLGYLLGLKDETMQLKHFVIAKNGQKKTYYDTAEAAIAAAAVEDGATYSTEINTAATWKNVAAQMAKHWYILVIIAALAALATAIYFAVEAYNEEANAAKRAAEATEELNESQQDLQEKSTKLKNTWDAYDTAVKKLDECVKGTKEWEEALKNVNDAAQDVLDVLPDNLTADEIKSLYSMDKGYMELKADKIASYQEKYDRGAETAQYAAQAGKVSAANAKIEADAIDAIRDLIAVQNAYVSASEQGQYAPIGNGEYVSYLDEDFIKENILNNMSEWTGLEDNDFKKKLEALGVQTELLSDKTLTEFQSIVEQLGEDAKAASEKMRLIAKLQVEEQFGDQYDDTSKAVSAEVLADRTQELQQAYLDLYTSNSGDKIDFGNGVIVESTGINKASNENNAIYQQALEDLKAAGYDYDKTKNGVWGTDSNRYFVFNKDGEDVKRSAEWVAQTVAASKALAELENIAIDASAALMEMEKTVGEEQSSAIKNMITSGNLNNLTENELTNLKVGMNSDGDDAVSSDEAIEYLRKAFAGQTDEEIAQIFGKDTIAEAGQMWADVITSTGDKWNEVGDSFVKTVNTALNNLDLSQLSMEEAEALGGILNQAFANAGSEGMMAISSMYSEAVANGFGDEFVNALSEIDWTNVTPESLNESLHEAGVNMTFADEQLQKLIATMYQVGESSVDASEKYKTLHEVVDGLKTGDTIDAEAFKNLGTGMDEYFVQMADGTYKLIADAEEFYKFINEQSISQFKQEISSAIQDNSNIENVLAHDISSISAIDNASGTLGGHIYTGNGYIQNQDVAKTQLDFLEITQGADISQIQEWREQVEKGTADVKAITEAVNAQVEAMGGASAVEDVLTTKLQQNSEALAVNQEKLATTAANMDELNQMWADGLISAEAYGKALESVASKEAEAYGLDPEEFENLSEMIEESGDAIKGLSKDLKGNKREANDVAKSLLRYDKAVQSVNENYEDWNETLKSGNLQDQAEIIDDVRAAYGDLMDIDGDALSDNFLRDTENLKLLQQAIQGNEEAYKNLQAAAAQDILMTLGLNDAEAMARFQSDLDWLMSYNSDVFGNIADLEVGANLNDEAFLSALSNLVTQAGMTADQATTYLASMGVDAEVVEDTTTTSDPTTYVSAIPSIRQNRYVGTNPITGLPQIYSTPSIDWNLIPETDESTKSTTAVGLKVVSANKSSGGNFKHSNSSSGSGVKKSKGSSSGGSKNNKPATIDKGDTTQKSDIVDRYHEVNDAIDNVADALERAGRATDRLWGKDKLNSMREENKILQEQYKLLQKKAEEAEAYAKEDAENLKKAGQEAGVTFTIDATTGDITNAEDAMETLYNRLANAENEYNKKVDEYNKTRASMESGGFTDEETEKLKKMEEALKAYEENIVEKIRDEITSVEDAMALYEESKELYEDLGLDMEEILDQIMQNNYDIIMEGLEIPIALNEEDLRLIDLQLSKLEDSVYSMEEAVAFTSSKLDEYKDNLRLADEALSELNRAHAAGEITDAAYHEGLSEIKNQYYDNIEALIELDKQMKAYYGETLDAANEELSKYTEQMEHQTSVLEHYQTLLELMGKQNDYKMIGKVLQGQVETTKNQAEVSKQWYESRRADAEELKRQYEEAVAAGASPEELDLLKTNWQAAEVAANEAQEQMLSDAEAWAEALTALLENKLNELGQTLEDQLTGDWGSFDAMTTAMERANSLQEEYLTTTNQIYETNKLMRTAQQEIDKTTNSAAKKRLQAYINETQQLQDQSKLSQYELEIQQAKYDLLLAEIALEEAQDAKSTVRLQRDSEGNFGYVYTADSNKIAEAQQQLEDAQNELYNIGLEGANSYTEKYQQTMAEMYDTLRDLQSQYQEDAFATEEEYQKAVTEATDYYYQKLKDFSSLYQVSLTTDSRVIADAWSSDFSEMTYQTEQWMSNIQDYNNQVIDAFRNWEQAMTGPDGVSSIVGSSLEDVADNVTEITDKSKELAKTTKEEVIPLLNDEIDAVANLTGKYANLRDTITEIIEQYGLMIGKINAGEENEYNGGGSSSGGTSDTRDSDNNSSSGDNNNSDGTTTSGADFSGTSILSSTKSVRVKSSARNFSAKSGNAQMATWVPGSEFQVYQVIGNEVLIGDPARKGIYTGWVNADDLEALDTGGYTGQWGSYGKLAMLHEKELVLNAQDTANFLSSMEVLERILQIIDLQATSSQIGGMLYSPSVKDSSSVIEQSVHIEASFPAVQDRNEIEEAFNNLINKASQYANRK